MVGAEGRHSLAAGRLLVQKLINCCACMPQESLLGLEQRSGDRVGLEIWGWLDVYELITLINAIYQYLSRGRENL